MNIPWLQLLKFIDIDYNYFKELYFVKYIIYGGYLCRDLKKKKKKKDLESF